MAEAQKLQFPQELSVVEGMFERPGAGARLGNLLKYVSECAGLIRPAHFSFHCNSMSLVLTDTSGEDLKPLLRITLASVGRLGDPLIRRRAGVLWRRLLDRGGKSHEGCFAALGAASKKAATPNILAAIFDWSCQLASSAAFSEGGAFSGASFAKLAALQFGILGRVCNSDAASKKQVDSCISKFHSLLLKHSSACQLYIGIASSCKDTAEVIGSATSLLSFCSTKAGQEHLTEARKTFTALYTTVILGGTEGRDGRKPSRPLTSAFNMLFRSFSHDDFAGLLPELIRILRRTPEFFLESLAQSIHCLSIDTSRYVEQLTPIVCERLMSEKTRDDSLALVSALCKQSSDTSTLAALATDILQTLAGKGNAGTIKSWQERQGLLLSLQLVISMPKGKGMSALAEECSATVLAVTDKEVNDATKCIGARTLGTCIRRCEKISTDATKFYVKGLESTNDAVRRSMLESLREAMESHEIREKVQDIVPALCKLVSSAEKKPGIRGDALLASRLLISVHAADETRVEPKLAEIKFWASLISGQQFVKSYLLSDAGTSEELIALVEVFDAILHGYAACVQKSSEENRASFFHMLAMLLAHKDWKVHKAAAAAVQKLVKESTEFVPLLMDQLHILMRTTIEDEQVARRTNSGEETRKDDTHYSVRFSRALLACVASPPPIQLLAKTLLMVHSPAVLCGPGAFDGTGKPRLWRMMRQGLEKQSANFVQSMSDNIPALSDGLLSEQGIHSSNDFDRQSALNALSSLSQQAFHEVFPRVFQVLRDDLDYRALLSFSKRDVEIYKTPEGQLARFSDQESGYVPEVRENTNVRVSKEEKKMYGDLAKELGSKKKEVVKPKMSKQEEEVFKGKLAEEAAIRANIALLRGRAELALEVIDRICTGNRAAAHDYLAQITRVVYPLAPCRLLSESLQRLIPSLVTCCSRQFAAGVSDALYLVSRAGGSASGLNHDETEIVRGATQSALEIIARTALPVESFAVVFPLLRHALLHGASKPEMQDAAIAAMALHTDPAVAWPRAEMLTVLIEVVMIAPRVRKTAVEVIMKLSGGLDPANVGELLDGGLSPSAAVRTACLDGLARVHGLSSDNPHIYLQSTLFLLQHDPEEVVREKATALYDKCDFRIETVPATQLTQLLSNPSEVVRKAAGDAMASLLKQNPAAASETVAELKAMYIEAKWEDMQYPDEGLYTRSGVALTLQAIAEMVTKRELIVLFPFLVSDKNQGLSDPDDTVRSQMTQAGLRLIELHGQSAKELLTPMFENQINRPDTGTVAGDLVKEGAVIFLATLAKFLPKGDPKVKEVLDRLVKALHTPSESVQRAASNCMSPLMNMLGNPDDAKSLIQDMLDLLLTGESYGHRRGAAFGLAGMVKGLGISALKAHEIMQTLQTAAADKKNERRRQGALFGFESLSEKLGRLFEPYVIHILPILLNSCGDADVSVREAAEAAARAVMSQLSGQGVKLVMPALLQGVEDRTWRTKAASVDLLGAMAYCAPRQLGTCLPTIVPVLAAAVSDTHAKVREGAKAALGQVGNVIKNPEILAIANTLIESLSEPDKTARALEVVIETTFVNAVDAPSLALLVPVVQRGLQSRNIDMKKKASTIVGNMCNLVADPKDVSPYLGDLLPTLKTTILDPSPEVRMSAAKALGSLVKSMDDSDYTELQQYLLLTMKSEASMVERSGAALGFSEVLGAAPISRFEAVLDEVLTQCEARLSHIREGYYGLMAYLPGTMGDALEPFIPRVLPTILNGLSDEKEPVREIALRAGHGLVDHYAETAMPLVLPAIEKGLFDDAWRIRASSVHLLGDVLSKITGRNWKIYSGNATVDDVDEGTGDRSGEAKIGEVLGLDRRNKLLAAVYMLRSDVNPTVCQASFQVWKSVVQSQSRTLRAILSTLMDTLIICLASPSEEKQVVAGRAMGEMVGKIGERVLPEVIPILRASLASPDPLQRAGVCLGLSEVMGSCSRPQVNGYLDELVSTVLLAICDNEDNVRTAAALAFDALYKQIQHRAIEEIVPALLDKLDSDDGNSLSGLRQLLAVRGRIVLPFLVPKLIAPPMTASNAKALAALAEVAGEALSSRTPTVLGALLDGMCEGDDRERIAASAERVVLSIPQDGIRLMLLELLRRLEDICAPRIRTAAARLARAFCAGTDLDWSEHIGPMARSLVHLLGDADDGVQAAACEALQALVAKLEAEDRKEDPKAPAVSLAGYVSSILEEVKALASSAPPTGVLGFNRPKGLAPVVPFFLQPLMHGATPEAREQAADGLGELVQATSEAALRPMVVQMTGPLIRIIGDRFPWQVKAAILKTMTLLLVKGGVMMKPFLPQLQTTFVKCLGEHSRVVRARAVRAVAKLVLLSPRVDPLLNDLLTGAKTADKSAQVSFVQALEMVVGRAGKAASAPVMANIVGALDSLMTDDDDTLRFAAAAAFGAHSTNVSDQEVPGIVEGLLDARPEWVQRHGRGLALAALLKHLHQGERAACGAAAFSAAVGGTRLRALAGDDRAPVREAAADVLGQGLRLLADAPGDEAAGGAEAAMQKAAKLLAGLLVDTSPEVRVAALRACKLAARSGGAARLQGQLATLVPGVFAALKDKTAGVRTLAERAVLHLLQLYAGIDLALSVAAQLREAEGAGLTDYCRRCVDKGADATAASDEDEDGAPAAE